ncbi:MAG: hypothetical protein ACLFPQ_05810 [Candidatus Woesearchaeota archaeon]
MDTTLLKNFLKIVNLDKIDKDFLKENLMEKGWPENVIDSVYEEMKTNSQENDKLADSDEKIFSKEDSDKNIDGKSDDDSVLVNQVQNQVNDNNEQSTVGRNIVNSDLGEFSSEDKSDSDASEEKQNLDEMDDPLDNTFVDDNLPEDTEKETYQNTRSEILSEKDYVERLRKYIIPFIGKGYNKFYIRRQFTKAGWDSRLYETAYNLAEEDVMYRRKSIRIEKEILLRLITGDNKESIVKVLLKKRWPDDNIKRNFENFDKGIEEFKKSLYEVDLNEYNIDEIKSVLIQKGWPSELVERTIEHLSDKIEYHRQLLHMQDEVRAMMHSGKDAKKIETRLLSEGYPRDIVNKIILKLNFEIVKNKDIDRFKTFNNTNLKHKNYHHFSEITDHFYPLDKSANDISWKESLRKEDNSLYDNKKNQDKNRNQTKESENNYDGDDARKLEEMKDDREKRTAES